jgi:hypothetical protein
MCRVGWTASCFFILAGLLVSAERTQSFKFVLLGDRTGEAQPGVYEQIWSEIGREKPSFVLSGGDTIQGGNDNTARQEWKAVFSMLAPYRSIPFYLVPGNHDVWSPLSESLFRQFARRPVHYSFDYGQLHVTVLDNSRTEELAANELKFLTSDLDAHKQQPLKMIISHRPSWLIPILFSSSKCRSSDRKEVWRPVRGWGAHSSNAAVRLRGNHLLLFAKRRRSSSRIKSLLRWMVLWTHSCSHFERQIDLSHSRGRPFTRSWPCHRARGLGQCRPCEESLVIFRD